MVESDDDDGSDLSSCEHDVFDTNNDVEIYEDLQLKDGAPSVQLPSRTTWKYDAFTDRGSEFVGELKKSVAKQDKRFILKYNTIDRVLFDKAKTEFKRSLTIIEADLKERTNSSTITPFTAFASVCPEEFFILFRTWLKHGDSKNTPFCFGEICEFWRCEIIMMSLELSAVSLRQKVSENEHKTYLKIKEIMSKADIPASTRKPEIGVAALPPFSFDPIFDDMVSALNRLWSRLFFAPGCTWVDIDDDKIPHCSRKWKLHGWKTQPTKDKKLKPVVHLMASVSTGFLIWLCPQKMIFRLSNMLKNAIDTVLPSGNAALRSQLVLFLDRGYLEVAKNQNGDNITNLIQLMMRFGVRFVGTVKNTAAFPFMIHDHNLEKARTSQNKVVLQSYGIRSHFSCKTKVGTEMMLSVLRNGIGKIRSARIATNVPMLMENSWVYELSSGDLGTIDIKRNKYETILNPTSSSKIEENNAWEIFLDEILVMTQKQRTVDWFLMRMFRFTSTTLHVILNVRKAIYLDELPIQLIHTACKNIAMITPSKDINLDNSLTESDADVGDLRKQAVTSASSDTNCKDDMSNPAYYRRGNSKTKQALQQLCQEMGVAFTEKNTKKELSEALAQNYIIKMRDQPIIENETTAMQRKQAFMNRMIKHWFMHPFTSSNDSAINLGKENESITLKILQNYIRSFSKNKFRGGKIREYGLLVNKKVRSCATSPDGIIPLYHKADNGVSFKFYGLCIIEIKTKSSITTITDLEKSISKHDSNFSVCNVGTNQFQEQVNEPAYRTQICQHAAATGIKNVLLVYTLPGALIKKLVLVKFCSHHLTNLVNFQMWLQEKYLSQLYPTNNSLKGDNMDIESLGKDYGEEYGYAIEHHTVDLWLRLWVSHDFDVRNKGTPPPCKRLLDITTSCWNKCMGNVDTVRRLLCYHKVKRGRNSGPGSLVWYMIFNYILVNAYKTYMCKVLVDHMDSNRLKSWQQLKMKRKRDISFRNFLDSLANRDQFGLFMIDKVYPGLRQKIDHNVESPSKPASSESIPQKEKDIKSEDKNTYRFILNCIDPEKDEFKIRLNKDMNHMLIPNEKRNSKNRTQRLRCVLCCWKCEKEEPQYNDHYRQGKTTTKTCLTCQVPICSNCYSTFHNVVKLELPVCISKVLKKPFGNEIITRHKSSEPIKKGVCIKIKNERKEINTSKNDKRKANAVIKSDTFVHQAIVSKKVKRNKRSDKKESNDVNEIKIEDIKLCNTKNRYYLKQSLRSSQIPKEHKRMIELFAAIQNVSGDGNCGIYSIMEGLYHNDIDFNTDVDCFRRSIVEYIDCNRNKILPGLQFRNKRKTDGTIRGRSKDDFIDKEVKDRIWNKDTIFNGGCDSKYWVDSQYMFPIIAEMYKLNVVWYTIIDSKNAKTNATLWRDGSWVDVEREGIQNPFLLIPGMNWRKIILIVHYRSHYQCLKLHIPV